MELGFKKLSVDNWLEPEEISCSYVDFSLKTGKEIPVTGDRWVKKITAAELTESVPQEIIRMYEVARAPIAYGYFFYPLYALAEEQLLRVLEAAVALRFQMLKPQNNGSGFRDMINFLILKNIIPAADKERWHQIRKMRNEACHMKHQKVIMPIDAIRMLYSIKEDIEQIFKKD